MMREKCRCYIMTSNNFGKRNCLTQYTWTIQDAENVKGFQNNLLQTEINDEACMLLKREESSPCNPDLVMDLGHNVMKAGKQLQQCYTNTDVAEVKRRILQEQTMLLTGSELLITVKEINSLKKELQINTKKVSGQIKGSQLNAYSRNRHNKSNIISITGTENILSSSSDMSNTGVFPERNIKTNEYEISHNPVVDFQIINNSPNSIETKVFTNTDVIINDGRMTGITPEITDISMKSQNNERVVYNRKGLMWLVWKKWKRLTLDKKLSMEEDHTSETKNDVSKNIQTQINKKVMKKFWDIWLQVVREKKGNHSAAYGKLQMEERIDKFLKELQERKQSLIAITAATMTRDLNNAKRGTENNSEYSYHNFQPKNKSCNKQNIQDNVGFQTKTFPSDLNNEYQYRFEVQQNIIAEQKSKLEEQSKLIKELQLAHLRLQTEKSTKEAQEEINQMLSSCELRLKPKAKQVKNRLCTVDKKTEYPENKLIVTSLKTVPTIVNRMEERAQERETRWRLIKERKQKLTEEREKRKREEEEERKQKEECEKRQKMEELKEKRRLEKQMEIQKKREREIMHNLMIKASLQYKELLMKKVICSLKQLVTHKWMLTDRAENHYKTHLLRNSFHIWRTHVQSIISFRMYRVTALHNRILMKKVFRGLFQVYAEYITKNQVATDFYDTCLQEHIFIGWYRVACTEHVVTLNKQEQAKVHYNRKLLTQYFKRWQQLPSVLQLEREKEQRKQIWRKKVQEMLPDFRSVLTTLEDSDLMN